MLSLGYYLLGAILGSLAWTTISYFAGPSASGTLWWGDLAYEAAIAASVVGIPFGLYGAFREFSRIRRDSPAAPEKAESSITECPELPQEAPNSVYVGPHSSKLESGRKGRTWMRPLARIGIAAGLAATIVAATVYYRPNAILRRRAEAAMQPYLTARSDLIAKALSGTLGRINGRLVDYTAITGFGDHLDVLALKAALAAYTDVQVCTWVPQRRRDEVLAEVMGRENAGRVAALWARGLTADQVTVDSLYEFSQ